LQAAFSGLWGPWVGVPVAAAVFGLLHMITPTYALLAAGMGIYLGCAWLATDNLLAVVVAHAVYDFIALIYLLRVEGPPELLPPPRIDSSF
jgi:membrane protease YdiL (CAAX protease family)